MVFRRTVMPHGTGPSGQLGSLLMEIPKPATRSMVLPSTSRGTFVQALPQVA